jgi:hypothetical protein
VPPCGRCAPLDRPDPLEESSSCQEQGAARRDSSDSSRPSSSDSRHTKKTRDRSLRERGRRRRGKQTGEPGTTMNLVDNPDERIECPPTSCCGCGAGLAGEPPLHQRRHQVTTSGRPRRRR